MPTDRPDRPASRHAVTGAVFCPVFFVVAGCADRSQSAESPPSAVQADSAGVPVTTITGDVGRLPIWQTGGTPEAELLGDSPPFVGRVGEVAMLGDGRVLIEDDQSGELHLLEADGSSVRRWAAAGEGPGEFQDVTNLTAVEADTVFAYDRRLNRFSSFAPSGSFLTSVSVDPGIAGDGARGVGGWAFGSGQMLVQRKSPLDIDQIPDGNWRDQRDALLFPLDHTGHARGSPLQFQDGYQIRTPRTIIVPPFSNAPIVAVGDGRLARGSGLTYELFLHGPDFTLQRIIRWQGWRTPVTEADLQAARAAAETAFEGLRERNAELAESVLTAMFSPEFVPDSLPTLGSALIDDRGRIWVSRFLPATERWAQRDAWHVLASDGTPLARLVLPDQARLAAVRDDRITVVERDSLDVQHVRVYALRPGGASP